jgi:hypothetical protein
LMTCWIEGAAMMNAAFLVSCVYSHSQAGRKNVSTSHHQARPASHLALITEPHAKFDPGAR